MSCFSCLFGRRSSIQLLGQKIEGFSDIPGIEDIRIYSYKELRNATNDFSAANKVGEGGFSSVFKGKLKDGTVVAIEVLSSDSRQGVREFLTEITVISGIVHDNLVELYGCCVEGIHRIIVYNYLENNSLAQTLLVSAKQVLIIAIFSSTREQESKFALVLPMGLHSFMKKFDPT